MFVIHIFLAQVVFASFCPFCHKVFAMPVITGFFRSGKNLPTLIMLIKMLLYTHLIATYVPMTQFEQFTI